MIGTFSLTLAWLPRRVLTGESDGPRVIVPLYPLELSAFCMNCCILWSGALVNVATASDAIYEEQHLLPR